MKKIMASFMAIMLLLELFGACTPLRDTMNKKVEAADLSWTLIKTFGNYGYAWNYSKNQLFHSLNISNYSSTVSMYPSSYPSAGWNWEYNALMSYRVEVWAKDSSNNEVFLAGAWDDFVNKTNNETVLDTITTATPYIVFKVFQKQVVFPEYKEGSQEIYTISSGRDSLVYANGNYYTPGLPNSSCVPGGTTCVSSMGTYRINSDLSLSSAGISMSGTWGGMGTLGVDDQDRPFSIIASPIWNDGRSYIYTYTIEDSGSITQEAPAFPLIGTVDLDGVYLTKNDGTRIPYVSRLTSQLSYDDRGDSYWAQSIYAGPPGSAWNEYTLTPTNTATRIPYWSYNPMTTTIRSGNRIYSTIATNDGGYLVYYQDFNPSSGNFSSLTKGSDGKFPLDDLKNSYTTFSPETIKYNGTGFSYVTVDWPTGPHGEGYNTYYQSKLTYKETDASGNVILSVDVPNKAYYPTSPAGNTWPTQAIEYAVSLNGNYATIAAPDPESGGISYSIIDRSNGNIVKQASTYRIGSQINRIMSAKNMGDPNNATFLICAWDSMCRALQIPVKFTDLNIVTPTSGQILSDLNTTFVPTVKASGSNYTNLTVNYFIDSESSPRETKTISNTETEQTVSFNAINLGALTEGTHSIRFTVNDGTNTVERSVSFVVDKSAPLIESFQAASSDTAISVTGAASDSPAGL
ncbi:hypothetical protein, partial [Cohnella fermenti]